MTDIYDKIKEGERGAWLSITAYLLLSALKLTIGYVFLSSALQADGLNNLTDIVASVAVLVGLRISRKPPDADHAYGHFRAETVAALTASIIMAFVGLEVLVSAAQTLSAGSNEAPRTWVAGVALLCAMAMYGVYRYNRNLSIKTGSLSLMAAAKDNLSDALVSVGAAIGILGSQLGMPWLDGVTAFIVGLIICRTAWEILRESLHRLTDGFDQRELERIRATIAGVEGVEEIRELKARVNGSQTVLDVVVEVPRDLSLVEAHDIADHIEERLEEKHEIYFASVHVEPVEAVEAGKSEKPSEERSEERSGQS